MNLPFSFPRASSAAARSSASAQSRNTFRLNQHKDREQAKTSALGRTSQRTTSIARSMGNSAKTSTSRGIVATGSIHRPAESSHDDDVATKRFDYYQKRLRSKKRGANKKQWRWL